MPLSPCMIRVNLSLIKPPFPLLACLGTSTNSSICIRLLARQLRNLVWVGFCCFRQVCSKKIPYCRPSPLYVLPHGAKYVPSIRPLSSVACTSHTVACCTESRLRIEIAGPGFLHTIFLGRLGELSRRHLDPDRIHMLTPYFGCCVVVLPDWMLCVVRMGILQRKVGALPKPYSVITTLAIKF